MTLDEWGQALLSFGLWPITLEKRIGIVAWAMAEGNINVPECSGAIWNPLDTTEPAPQSTDFNAAGVKDYPDEQTGLAAVLATLRNGRYANVLAVLADEGASAMSLAQAVGNSPWGTGDFSWAAEQVKADPAPFFAVQVPGSSGPGPSPTPSPTQGADVPIYVRNSDTGDEYSYDGRTLYHLNPQEAAIHQVALGDPHEVNTGGLSGIPVANP
jgi:hypothetical protein